MYKRSISQQIQMIPSTYTSKWNSHTSPRKAKCTVYANFTAAMHAYCQVFTNIDNYFLKAINTVLVK